MLLVYVSHVHCAEGLLSVQYLNISLLVVTLGRNGWFKQTTGQIEMYCRNMIVTC